MKCEMCHQVEAETVVHKTIAGEIRELFVCQECARKESRRDAPHPPLPHAGGEDGISAVPLMGMILDAAFEIVGKSISREETACPVCGISRGEYRKRSRLGCPACYEAFSKDLEAAISDLHRATQHTGKTPEKAKSAWQRQQLLNALDDAVRGQRYEEAIILRDQLAKLGGDESAKRRQEP